jgi:hypothetical protein
LTSEVVGLEDYQEAGIEGDLGQCSSMSKANENNARRLENTETEGALRNKCEQSADYLVDLRSTSPGHPLSLSGFDEEWFA